MRRGCVEGFGVRRARAQLLLQLVVLRLQLGGALARLRPSRFAGVDAVGDVDPLLRRVLGTQRRRER